MVGISSTFFFPRCLELVCTLIIVRQCLTVKPKSPVRLPFLFMFGGRDVFLEAGTDSF